MWAPDRSILETVLRVVSIYCGLLVLVRLAGKREVGQLSPMEFLSVLLISEAVSPSLTAQDTSLTTGLVAAATVIGMTVLMNVLAYRSKRIEKVLEGRADVLIKAGKVDPRVMRKERITEQQLLAAMRRHDVERVADVRRAYVETDGEITVLKNRSGPERAR
jgi:uncharacterized membrane protein YcaP (DUF421 family)